MTNNFFSIFSPYANLLVAISKKENGSCRSSSTGQQEIDASTKTNREKYLAKIGVKSSTLVSADLAHKNAVHEAGLNDGGKIIPCVDALITNEKNLFLSVTVADCLPVFFYDQDKKAVGLAHAGSRGLVREVIPATIRKMKAKFGSAPSDILVGIGPGIGVCHYDIPYNALGRVKELTPEIDASTIEKLKNILPQILAEHDGKTFLNLKKMAKLQLEECGIKSDNIEVSTACTYDAVNKYFSWRRDHPEYLEAVMAVIGMREN